MFYLKPSVVAITLTTLIGCSQSEFDSKADGNFGALSSSYKLSVGEDFSFKFNFTYPVEILESGLNLEDLVKFNGSAQFSDMTTNFSEDQKSLELQIKDFSQAGQVTFSIDTSKLVSTRKGHILKQDTVIIDVLSSYFSVCGDYAKDSETYYNGVSYFLCLNKSKVQIWKFDKSANALLLWRSLDTDADVAVESLDVYHVDVKGELLLFSTTSTKDESSVKQSWIFNFATNKLINLPVVLSPKTGVNPYGGSADKNFYIKNGQSVYVSATTDAATDDHELYKFNLETAQANLIENINSLSSSNPWEAALDDNKQDIYFSALCDGCDFRELFKLNLQTDQVDQLTSIGNSAGSNPTLIVPLEDHVLYAGLYYSKNPTYSGNIYFFNKQSQTVEADRINTNPYGGYPLRPFKFFKAGDRLFFEGFVGTASEGDGDPIHMSLFELDAENKTINPILTREEILGPVGQGCWLEYSCHDKTRAADVRINNKTMQWKQWTAPTDKTLLYTYDLDSGVLSSEDIGVYVPIEQEGAYAREQTGSTFDLNFKGAYKLHPKYGLGYFVR